MIKQLTGNNAFASEDGKLPQRTVEWTRLVTEMDILEGSGTPETFIEAKTRRLYMDTAGTAGNILYIKQLPDIGGDRTQGWILI